MRTSRNFAASFIVSGAGSTSSLYISKGQWVKEDKPGQAFTPLTLWIETVIYFLAQMTLASFDEPSAVNEAMSMFRTSA
jgi:hypothetical protein